MVRLGLAAVIAMVVPTVASADWINPVVDTGYQATLSGIGGSVYAGAFTTSFHHGTLPTDSAAPSFATGIFTFCVSTDRDNTANDSYNITYDIVQNAFGNSGLVNALVYILDQTLTNATASFRAAAQAVIWQELYLHAGTGHEVTSFTGGMGPLSDYANLLAGANGAYSGGYFGQTNINSIGFAGGPGGPLDNQNMIWVNGPTGGVSGPVPVPATVYGGIAAFAALFASRRIFGIVA